MKEIIENNTEVALNLTTEEKAVLARIKDVSEDIADIITTTYNIEADPSLIAMAIARDLSLIGGKVNPEDLSDTPMDKATKDMFDSYESFYDDFDNLVC